MYICCMYFHCFPSPFAAFGDFWLQTSADSAEGLSSSEDNEDDHQMHQKSDPWPGGQPSISTMDLSS